MIIVSTSIANDNLGGLYGFGVGFLAKQGSGTSPLHVNQFALGGVCRRSEIVRAGLRGALVDLKLQTVAFLQKD